MKFLLPLLRNNILQLSHANQLRYADTKNRTKTITLYMLIAAILMGLLAYLIYSPCVNKEPKNFEKPEDVSGLAARRVLRLFIRRIMPRICRLNQSMSHIRGLCEGSRHNQFR